jgi:hypothetical protein
MGERRGACIVLEGKPKGKRPLGKPRYRCENNIRIDLKRSRLVEYGLDSCGSSWGQVVGCP